MHLTGMVTLTKYFLNCLIDSKSNSNNISFEPIVIEANNSKFPIKNFKKSTCAKMRLYVLFFILFLMTQNTRGDADGDAVDEELIVCHDVCKVCHMINGTTDGTEPERCEFVLRCCYSALPGVIKTIVWILVVVLCIFLIGLLCQAGFPMLVVMCLDCYAGWDQIREERRLRRNERARRRQRRFLQLLAGNGGNVNLNNEDLEDEDIENLNNNGGIERPAAVDVPQVPIPPNCPPYSSLPLAGVVPDESHPTAISTLLSPRLVHESESRASRGSLPSYSDALNQNRLDDTESTSTTTVSQESCPSSILEMVAMNSVGKKDQGKPGPGANK